MAHKLIKIGSSVGVTVPKHELEKKGLKVGDEVDITVRPLKQPAQHDRLMGDYRDFVKQYGQTLKNLAKR